MTAHRPADPARHLAHQLAEGEIVGVFRGRLEAGPRALGNRSTHASPLRPDIVHRLNAKVKFREPFRPFASVALADKAADYFTLGQPAPSCSPPPGTPPAAGTPSGSLNPSWPAAPPSPPPTTGPPASPASSTPATGRTWPISPAP
ncbi:carbamoyltransferase C-terminal domain-containing protein [Streptomyces sp. NPDC097981]|uniref:carbamoyltransferase C-terminal domain-containing protein n=1 Tax=Streptomyces sp. NPDC097981 TaxID=3155428 RepID=UPI00332968A7